MDQMTPFRTSEDVQSDRSTVRVGIRIAAAIFIAALLVGATLGGYQLARSGWQLPIEWIPERVAAILNVGHAAPAAAGPVAYYRHPDGIASYSAEPRKTEDGRDYVPVRASEDVSFEADSAHAAHAGHGETQAGGADKGGRRILYYRNPMGLPDTSPVPKKDSMGMDYVPVYEGEVDDGSTVKVSLGKLQRTGVRSEPVTRHAVTRPVRSPGTVQLDERRVAVVATRSESFIDKVENVTTGDRVRAGQRLVRLYSPDINSAAAQLIANPGFEGSRRRLQNLNVSDDVIAEIERTRKVPLAIEWSAPRDGVVLERNAIDGMRAAAGDVLFRIADLSTVWVLVDVPEHELGFIRPGQTAAIRAHALPGRSFAGKISQIYPQVNKDTRTTRVRIEIPNPDGVLLPDMYADVEIATGSTKPVIAVPDSAVIDSGTRQVVILDKGEGRFEPRQVKLGVRGQGFVEVREGVSDGDQVVVAANFLIDAESNLKAALRAMTAGESQP